MSNVRRTEHAFFSLEDDYVLDPVSLLQGIEPTPAAKAQIVALAVLTGERCEISHEDWSVLVSIPVDGWVSGDRYDPALIRGLLEKGLLLSDSSEPFFRELRERDETLTETAWHPYAGLYHFATRWSGIDIREDIDGDEDLAALTEAAVRELVAEHGFPPTELPHVRATETVSLPGRIRTEPIYRTLTERRTTRVFDLERPMALDDLDAVLRYVFGCHGYASRVEGVVCIKRTSPSGGGLHPITAYPIITNVEGVAPGVYHYNADDHSLALLSAMPAKETRELAAQFVCGQEYFATAHVSFVLAARFYRNHWKYRRHPRAYAGMLMEAGHLSQTLYLIAAELGLGAYVTIAINGADIETRLQLDGFETGALAVCGCGPRASRASALEPKFTARRPAVTR
ncbi:MAG TPA: putative peptide maturation dehydrogenase [Solirubrobacteraceae bacterium]|nr:putative peptide maturation dehydrogenase [Solirubrobacteraceae bacterium]